MGIEMGLEGDSMQKKYFGNMTHPTARWDSTPAVKSAVTTDVWLVRGGLRHPVSLVADEIPPQCIPSVVVCSS